MTDPRPDEARPTFISRNYGPRTVPHGAAVLSVGDEGDLTVWYWREDAEMVFLQQGYDVIGVPVEALRAFIDTPQAARVLASLHLTIQALDELTHGQPVQTWHHDALRAAREAFDSFPTGPEEGQGEAP